MAKPPLRRLLLTLVLVFVLGLVFAAYLRPEFISDLANRYILC